MDLSVVIPSYKDPLLQKTINSLLESSVLGDKLEIVVVFDGYWPDPPLIDDERLVLVHLGRNRGMREAINAAVSVARGKYLMRTDEHCMFAKGYDQELVNSCQDDWIMVMRRYFLDPVKWEVMIDQGYIDYEKLVIQDNKKFAGQRWKERTEERKDIMIDESMAMQGSCWCMPHAWWDKVIVKLQTEGYGAHYQDSHEMIFKTWKAGGKFMLNKNTWYAHKHRSFKRTHQEGTKENPANREAGWQYSLDTWREYYETEIRPKWGI